MPVSTSPTVIDSTSLPDDVRDAASKLATYVKAKAGHELNIKALASMIFSTSTQDALETVIKKHCAANPSIEGIRAVPENVVIKTSTITKDQASIIKLLSRCLDETFEMRREKQMLRLYDDNGLDADAAGDLLDEMNSIDKVELLARMQKEMEREVELSYRF